jgi:3-deoxy-D-manno-octulosonic-acid transferase
MQSDRDAERIVALGARPHRVSSIGNIKFDQPLPTTSPAQLDPIRRWVARHPRSFVVVAGSTHPGEEDILVQACEALRRTFPHLSLVMAPRHTERAADLEQALKERGVAVVRRSRLTDGAGTGDYSSSWVLLLDSRGELGAVYQYASVAFVGGTLVPVGGHNLLEPAAWGKPVLFGPYTDHCQDIAQLLEEAGGGIRVAGSGALVDQVGRWLTDAHSRQQAGQRAEQMVRDNQGALQRCLSTIEVHLAPASSLDAPPPLEPLARPVGSR